MNWTHVAESTVTDKVKAQISEIAQKCPRAMEFLSNDNFELDVLLQGMDDTGTILMHAVSRGHVELVRALVGRGADPNIRGHRGATALHKVHKPTKYKTSEAIIKIVNLLLVGGADVNLMDQDGMTPLHQAVRLGDYAVVQALVERGADVNAFDEENVMKGSGQRVPPVLLMLALFKEQCPEDSKAAFLVLEILVNNGADINTRSYCNEDTALHKAAYANNPMVARVLLAAGVEKDALNAIGKTALQLADSREFHTLLLQHGARDLDEEIRQYKQSRTEQAGCLLCSSSSRLC
ncbi:hypothetical protein CYMTET_10001 [Cymbomonas tetramitiformis]|uniref:Uncharacterized protein n=1 Tax=Cymbomonas tetramitiformis TaxID=36881 RepID=A0AAE0GPZ9_9CHLO|nr:hypothetical protein CYMTET_10001 [Cymbomonas tetramitiformis]